MPRTRGDVRAPSSGDARATTRALSSAGRTERRVYELIRNLDYRDLVRRGVVPDTSARHPARVERFPAWVYAAQKAGAAHALGQFGMFYDYMARKMIAALFPVPWGEEPLAARIAASPAANRHAAALRRVVDPAVPWAAVVAEAFELAGLYFGPADGPTLVVARDVPADLAGAPVLHYPAALAKLYPALGALNKFLAGAFGGSAGAGLAFNAELRAACPGGFAAVGHPDLLADRWVVDIKAVASFGPGKGRDSAAGRAMLQAFAYAAIARAAGRRVDHAGILLALHQTAVFADVRAWDSGPLFAALCAETAAQGRDPAGDAAFARAALAPPQGSGPAAFGGAGALAPRLCGGAGADACAGGERMGLHRGVGPAGLGAALAAWAAAPEGGPRRPAQVYLQAWRPGERAAAAAELAAAAAVVAAAPLLVFSHAPLAVNLANSASHYGVHLLKVDLELCDRVGARGSVFHCGTPGEGGYWAALDAMEAGILRALAWPGARAPLVLETPAGEGEVCATFEEFAGFFRRVRAQAPAGRLLACVDTAHVWAAGYWPLGYLERWEAEVGLDALALVHFNDSKLGRGSRRDLHEVPGRGAIGPDHMLRVALWCEARGVPYVFE